MSALFAERLVHFTDGERELRGQHGAPAARDGSHSGHARPQPIHITGRLLGWRALAIPSAAAKASPIEAKSPIILKRGQAR